MEEITATISAQAIVSGDAEATPIRYIADQDLSDLIGDKVDEYVEEHSGGLVTKTDFNKSQYRQDCDIANLYQMAKGQLYREEVDSTVARTKTVPTGACEYATIDAIGGMSRKGKNLYGFFVKNSLVFSHGFKYYYEEGFKGSATVNCVNMSNVTISGLKVGTQIRYCFITDGYNGQSEISSTFTCTTTGYTEIGSLSVSQMTLSVPSGAQYLALYINDGSTVQIEQGSTATAYEPYTDKLIDAPTDKVVSAGKNLLNVDNVVRGKWLYQVSGLAMTNEETTYFEDYIYVGDTNGITLSSNRNNMWFSCCMYDANKQIIGDKGIQSTTSNYKYTMNVADVEYVRISVLTSSIDIAQLELGNTATAYTPYKAPSTTTIPTTVINKCPDYGIGISADCNNTLRNKSKNYSHKVKKVDMATLTWTKAWTNAWYTDQITDGKTVDAPTNVSGKLLSANYTVGNPTTGTVGNMNYWQSGSNKRLAVCNGSTTNAPTGMLYYELAEEEIIDLSSVWVEDMDILQVEAGGTIAMHYPDCDTYSVDMPNQETYAIKVVNAL